MRRALKTAILVTTVFLALEIYWYFTPPPGGEGGKDPEFSITLVDNGENDYIDIKYIRAGTGFVRTPDPLPPRSVKIEVSPMENLYEVFEFGSLPEELPTGETARAFSNYNVVERGKFYRIFIYFVHENAPRYEWVCMSLIDNTKCE